MRTKLFLSAALLLALSGSLFAQTSWLDRPLNNWNTAGGTVPNAPRTLAPIDTRCREQIRNPETLADRAVTRAGWSLFGAAQVFGPVTVVNAMAGTDGMCRPSQYNTFVFVNDRFAGTLSPEPMDSRSDGSLFEARLLSPRAIAAEFNRYTSNDALCCPSQKSSVTYNVSTGARGMVRAENVETGIVCRDEGDVQTQDNIISGTVTYRQRIALPQTAVLTVRMEDVSRTDTSAVPIAEQRIQTEGKQVPIPFDLVFDRSKIQERNRYAVRAEISDGGRLLYVSDVNYPVLTQGNPRTVEITVVSVRGGGGQQPDQGGAVLRGTVTYDQRMALPQNATVTVRLFETADIKAGTVFAEETFSTNGRQVPIPFELNYQRRRLDQQRFYYLEAEILSDGKTLFRTADRTHVLTAGNPSNDIRLTLVPGVSAITGQTISLSKFGTGSMQIGDRAADFLIRASVSVSTNGDAEVSVSSLNRTITFTGKLTYFDDTTLRITVANSGDADASGEIEVKYSGRRLNSITGNNLVLDGQDVTLRF